MANIQSNFAIAITSMVIVCIILTGFPLACMLAILLEEEKQTLPLRLAKININPKINFIYVFF